MLQQTTVNQCLYFSTVLGAVIKCKQYSGITVESGTHVKSVNITMNIYADLNWKYKSQHKYFFSNAPHQKLLKQFN